MTVFPALLLGAGGSQTPCPDSYSDASTLRCTGARHLTLQVAGNGVYLQVGHGTEGNVAWDTEEPFNPMQASLVRECDWARVRNLLAGKAAEVMLSART